MQIKLLVSAAAIALVAGLGSASTADQLSASNQFNTLQAVAAQPLSPSEADTVLGLHVTYLSESGGTKVLRGAASSRVLAACQGCNPTHIHFGPEIGRSDLQEFIKEIFLGDD